MGKMKAYLLGDGLVYTPRGVIPKPHVRHFLAGWRGEEFKGKKEDEADEYRSQTDTYTHYLNGQRQRRSYDEGKNVKVRPVGMICESWYDIVDATAPPAPKKRIVLTPEQREEKERIRAASSIYANLPKIVAVVGLQDYGPCEGGASAICPHCGAEGRYVYSFLCDDGTRRGAMRGCFSKFPRHKFAVESARILDKEADYKKKGWNLPTWDSEIKAAIFDFADGKISEAEAERVIRAAQARRDAYRRRRSSSYAR
jgi:hypothetical protein